MLLMGGAVGGADVVVGEGSHNARRRWWLENEYGDRVDITGYAFRYRVYRRTKDASENNVDTELFEASGVIETAADGEFYVDFTTSHTNLPAGDYTAELVVWSSGTVTDPPTERYRGTFTVEGKLEAP